MLTTTIEWILSPQRFTQQPYEVAVLIFILQIRRLRTLCRLPLEKWQQALTIIKCSHRELLNLSLSTINSTSGWRCPTVNAIKASPSSSLSCSKTSELYYQGSWLVHIYIRSFVSFHICVSLLTVALLKFSSFHLEYCLFHAWANVIEIKGQALSHDLPLSLPLGDEQFLGPN